MKNGTKDGKPKIKEKINSKKIMNFTYLISTFTGATNNERMDSIADGAELLRMEMKGDKETKRKKHHQGKSEKFGK